MVYFTKSKINFTNIDFWAHLPCFKMRLLNYNYLLNLRLEKTKCLTFIYLSKNGN